MTARAVELKQRLEQMPDKKIPQLQLLIENDWLSAANDASQRHSYEMLLHRVGSLVFR